MISIVLVSAPLTLEARYGVFSAIGNTQPTFALVCLAAIAEQEGAAVHIIDAAAEGLTIEAAFRQISVIRPDIVGFSSTTAGIVAAGKLAALIKGALPESITVLGGCHVTAIPEKTLIEFPGFDLAVIGEGEATLREILRSVKSRKAVPKDLIGTAVRHNDSIVIHPRRAFIRNLDELPLPAWHLLRGFPDSFHPTLTRMKRRPCASVVLTRGCPNQCLFCDRSVFGNKVRSYTPSYAINVIRDLRHNYNVREVLIEDDTFIISRQRMEEFCTKIIEENIDITWSCLGRTDRVDPDILEMMKKAGCWHISFGIESGDQNMLDAMQKRTSLPEITSAINWSHKAGLKTAGFFMLGFPGETAESLIKTRNFALKLPLNDISIMQLSPFPGTAIYNNISQYGILEHNWEKMNALNPIFVPKELSQSDLDRARFTIIKSFYLRPHVVIDKLLNLVFNTHLLIPTFKGMVAFLKMVFTGRKK